MEYRNIFNHYIYLPAFLFIYGAFVGHILGAEVISLGMDKDMPMENMSLRLSCLVNTSEDINDSVILFLQKEHTSSFHCRNVFGTCTNDSLTDVITTDKKGIQLDIRSLNRTQHEGHWECWHIHNGQTLKAGLNVIVYTLPRGLLLSQGGNLTMDLAKCSLTMQCETDGCTYPAPVFSWYYKDMTQSSRRIFYKGSDTLKIGTERGCSFPEQIYASYLHIPIYSRWPDNSCKTVLFSCGVKYPESSRNIFSPDSEKITFAAAGEEKDQSDHVAVTIPVLIVVGAAPAVFCVTIIAIVIVLRKRRRRLAKRQNGYMSEEDEGNETQRNETPTAVNNDIPNEYEGLRRDVEEDIRYIGIQRVAESSHDMDTRYESIL